MFGPKQNYSSKHLDRTSTGPGAEQLRRLNSIQEFISYINLSGKDLDDMTFEKVASSQHD